MCCILVKYDVNFFYVGRMQGEIIIAMKDVSSMTFILHVFSKNNDWYHFFLFIAKYINTLLWLILKICILFSLPVISLFCTTQFYYGIKFCYSLLDGNREQGNRFESYEDLLQKKRAQERKYRLEIKTLTTINIMSSFLPERVFNN